MEAYRLSPQQRAALTSYEVAGASGGCANVCAVRIDGDLDVERLDASILHVIRSAEVLRTYYPTTPHGQAQAIADTPTWHGVDEIDLSSLEEGAQLNKIDEFCTTRPSRLPVKPEEVVAATLFKLGPASQVLVLSTLPLSSDAAAQVLLARKVLSAYASADNGAGRGKDEMQYADLAEWCAGVLEDPGSMDRRRFWEGAIARGSVYPDAIATTLAQRGVPKFVAGRTSSWVAAATQKKIDALAQELGVGRRHLLLAAWAALMWRLNADESLLIGLHCNGRTLGELKESLGLLARTVPLYVQGDSDVSFADFARRMAFDCTERDQRQMCLDLDALTRSSKADFPRVAFAYHDVEVTAVSANPASAVVDLVSHECPFLLKLEFLELSEAVAQRIWFDSQQLDAAEVSGLCERYNQMLDHILLEPLTSLGNLPILIEADRIAAARNIAPASALADPIESVTELIDKAARRRPAAPAISCGDRTLTYAEFDELATGLAEVLRAKGVGPDVPVGICMQRGTDVIVAIVAVLKAGGAYVPLDPEYPTDRVAFVLEDCGASLVLVDASFPPHLEQLPQRVERLTVGLTERGGSSCRPPPTKPVVPENLAYILYTSGSTGRPKGVAVTRRNLSYSTWARYGFYEDTPAAFLLLSSVAFDSSVAGIFWTLSSGGHLVIPGGENVIDGEAIGSAVRDQAVTHMLCLPSVYNLILDTVPLGDLESLRCVIVAGESCPPSLVEKHARSFDNVRLYNEYGPTECTVWCVACECSIVSDDYVPIGRAIPGASVVLLDDARRAVPIGSRGELYVAGPGVSAGYWQRPELTNERFITISIPGSGETLAYRTGDVARLTGDGSILFLGRRDYQVKINGYRIEIEEVENAINGIDGVQEAAVAVRENDAGSRQLAGFMRLTQGTTVDDIKERISAALPRYMVPTLLEAVDDFPRMPNGKVDRKSLSRLSLSLSSAQYAPPRNGVEQLQADLWAELLGRDRVGIEDDFFKLGGQSILATRLIAQLKDVLQLSVPVRMVFDNPTIARFTEALRRDQGRAPELDRIEAALADLDLEVVGP